MPCGRDSDRPSPLRPQRSHGTKACRTPAKSFVGFGAILLRWCWRRRARVAIGQGHVMQSEPKTPRSPRARPCRSFIAKTIDESCGSRPGAAAHVRTLLDELDERE